MPVPACTSPGDGHGPNAVRLAIPAQHVRRGDTQRYVSMADIYAAHCHK